MPYKDYEQHKQKVIEHYHKNRESILEARKEKRRAYIRQYKKQPEVSAKIKAYRKQYTLTHKKEKFAYDLKRNLNIELPVWEKMYQQQNGICPACQLPLGEAKPVTDHCHSTGKIRGLIHNHCNLFLGHIEKHGSDLANLQAYLLRHKQAN